MNKFRLTIQLLAIAIFTFAFASMAQAQATRTWVSGVGDDVNPCSRTAPCKTFAGAISKTADGGEIDCLDPGGFGTVTITKSITIDGTHGSGFGSILNSGTTGVNVNDSASGAPMTKVVRLKSLSIQGAGTGTNGINYTSAKVLFVEDCLIQNQRGGVAGSQGNGIVVNLTADGGRLYVRDTIITNCLNDGIRSSTSVGNVRVSVDNLRSDQNANGYHGMNGTVSIIDNSRFNNNTTDGITIEAGAQGGVGMINNCTSAANGNDGLQAGAGASSVRLQNTTLVHNLNGGVNLTGGTVFTFGNNIIRSNGTNVLGGALNTTETVQ
jgi:hypothetical protein